MRPLKEGLPGSSGISSLTCKVLLAGFPNTRFRCKSSFTRETVPMHSKGFHEFPELPFASRSADCSIPFDVQNTKLKRALAEAVTSIGKLESHVERLEEESRNLRGKLLRLDFDLTHTRATKSILGDKVEDLEHAIAADNEASRLRVRILRRFWSLATASA
jgi:hypothetical protein